MVLGKLSEEGGPFPGHLACLRKELNFSALITSGCAAAARAREIVPGKVLGALE